MKNADSLA